MVASELENEFLLNEDQETENVYDKQMRQFDGYYI